MQLDVFDLLELRSERLVLHPHGKSQMHALDARVSIEAHASDTGHEHCLENSERTPIETWARRSSDFSCSAPGFCNCGAVSIKEPGDGLFDVSRISVSRAELRHCPML